MVRRFRGRMLVSLYTFFGISSGLFSFPEQMVRFMECTENVLLGIFRMQSCQMWINKESPGTSPSAPPNEDAEFRPWGPP